MESLVLRSIPYLHLYIVPRNIWKPRIDAGLKVFFSLSGYFDMVTQDIIFITVQARQAQGISSLMRAMPKSLFLE